MPDIRLVKDNLKQITSSSVIRLISDVLLHNIDKIDNFKPSRMYYKDDVMYMYDAAQDKHKLYICRRPTLTPGPFVATDWTDYTFRYENTKIVLESEFKATVDATSLCAINQPLFDYERDYLSVYHSLRGRLRQNIDWKLNANKTSITLQGFTLYKNESLLFEIVK